jgi:TPR repeat protein
MNFFSTKLKEADQLVVDAQNLQKSQKLGVRKRSILLLKKAAKLGHPYAFSILGYEYNYGYLVKKSYKKAITYYEGAIKRGNKESLFLLGALLWKQCKNNEDRLRVVGLLKLSAKHGNIKAINNVGVAYEAGFGVKKNIAIATRYYKRAAKLGDKLGLNNVKRMKRGECCCGINDVSIVD